PIFDDDPDPIDEVGARVRRLDVLRRELRARGDEPDAGAVAPGRAVRLDVGGRARSDLAEIRLLDIRAYPDRLIERQRVDRRAGSEDRARLADACDDRAVGRRREARIVELRAPAVCLRSRELELGFGRGDLLVAEAGPRKRERFLRRAEPRGGLVPAGLREIDVAFGGQPPLVEAALTSELLLGIAQRGARLAHVRLGALDLLRPAAAAVKRDAGVGDLDLRNRRAQGLRIRLVVELGQQIAGGHALPLLEVHRAQAPGHAKAEIDLANIDIAVKRERPRLAAIGVEIPRAAAERGKHEEHDGNVL